MITAASRDTYGPAQHRSLLVEVASGVSLMGLFTLTPGDVRRPGGLRVERSGGLAGNQRLPRHDRETQRLQHLLWFSASSLLKSREANIKQLHKECLFVLVKCPSLNQMCKINQSHLLLSEFTPSHPSPIHHSLN